MFAPERVRDDVLLLSVTPVTLVPMTALMTLAAAPAPEFVIVPVLFTLVVERVMIPAPVEFSVRLPLPVTPPLKVRALAAGDKIRSWLLSVTAPLKVQAALLVIVATPLLPEATEIEGGNVTAPAPLKVALALPLASPIVITLPAGPKELATVPVTVPALIVRPEV